MKKEKVNAITNDMYSGADFVIVNKEGLLVPFMQDGKLCVFNHMQLDNYLLIGKMHSINVYLTEKGVLFTEKSLYDKV